MVLPYESLLHRVVLPLLSRHVVLPYESVLPRVVLPLLSRKVLLPYESVLPRAVLPLLSRHVVLPYESVLPRVVLPLLSRHVVLPYESVEHLVCAIAPKDTVDSATATQNVNSDFAFIFCPFVGCSIIAVSIFPPLLT